uniref:Uncharacterized protein n=1 Tax=Coccidioides posadasii RMSCC 3488 TaxID=454284 RepID=A0A0J6FKA6_COCPO|nr:hypothetical protein CPAG_06168 [Coccidioides posadasii RMSCC 3488]
MLFSKEVGILDPERNPTEHQATISGPGEEYGSRIQGKSKIPCFLTSGEWPAGSNNRLLRYLLRINYYVAGLKSSPVMVPRLWLHHGMLPGPTVCRLAHVKREMLFQPDFPGCIKL